MQNKLTPNPRSQSLYERAQGLIPGGVNSPVRAFRAVGGTPLFIRSARGAMLTDVDGRDYIDYVGSWGPMILGHARQEIISAIQEAAERGTSYGAPTELEVELAETVIAAVPSIEKLRLTSSGTEATMSALRLARGFTGRAKIVKFEGCYHGHSDSLLVRAGSGVLTLGIPGTPGIPDPLAALTRVVPYNDVPTLEQLLDKEGNDVACVILEPIAGNMGVVPPAKGYLQAVRDLTKKHGVLFICDEVMTGFRVHRGGAQALYGIEPDLSTFGKVIGGGLPVGAYGGRKDLMELIAPAGPIYQAGTLSGNPLAMRAGIATLELLDEPGAYERLESTSAKLAEGLRKVMKDAGLKTTLNRVGSMMTTFFTEFPVTDYATAATSDAKRYASFFHGMLERGVYLAPSQYEAGFVSLAHTEEDVEATVRAAKETLVS